MSKIIFDSQNCYQGYSMKEEAYVVGSIFDLSSNEEIQEESIEWSQSAYEEEMAYFEECLQTLIQAYEKRYRTTVYAIALAGYVGRWNGNFVGGKIIRPDENPIYHMGKVDHVEVEVDEKGIITLYGHHHDGTHQMKLYLLTENKLRKVAPNYLHYGEYTYKEMEMIFNQLKPLSLGKQGIQYYGSYAS